jgi:hypothetical protein
MLSPADYAAFADDGALDIPVLAPEDVQGVLGAEYPDAGVVGCVVDCSGDRAKVSCGGEDAVGVVGSHSSCLRMQALVAPGSGARC